VSKQTKNLLKEDFCKFLKKNNEVLVARIFERNFIFKSLPQQKKINSVENGVDDFQNQNRMLKNAFIGITWFTYRDSIEIPIGTFNPPSKDSTFKTDSGWGCMVRTGQMILCQALKRHFFESNIEYANLNYPDIRN